MSVHAIVTVQKCGPYHFENNARLKAERCPGEYGKSGLREEAARTSRRISPRKRGFRGVPPRLHGHVTQSSARSGVRHGDGSVLRSAAALPNAFSPFPLPWYRMLNCRILPRLAFRIHRKTYISNTRYMASTSSNPIASPADGGNAFTVSKITFPVSEVPANPLGDGKYIKTAAALMIGYVFLLFKSTACTPRVLTLRLFLRVRSRALMTSVH